MENTPPMAQGERLQDILLALTCVVIISAVIAIGINHKLANRDKRIETEACATYQVWVKLTNRHDITYEDWRLAKKHGLLPVQTQVESK